MVDKDIVEEAAKTLGLKELAPEIYQDLLQPATREVGKALLTTAKVVLIALGPLEGINWGYQTARQWLSAKVTQKLSRLDESEIQTPPLNIAGPAMLNLCFSYDQDILRNMYAELIASSMNKKKCGKVHPAFVAVIQQLIPEEGLLLEILYRKSGRDDVIIQRDRRNEHKFYEDPPISWAALSISEILMKYELEFNSDIQTSLENLLRLKLLELQTDSETQYSDSVGDYHREDRPIIKLHIGDSLVFTEFGLRFIESCIDFE